MDSQRCRRAGRPVPVSTARESGKALLNTPKARSGRRRERETRGAALQRAKPELAESARISNRRATFARRARNSAAAGEEPWEPGGTQGRRPPGGGHAAFREAAGLLASAATRIALLSRSGARWIGRDEDAREWSAARADAVFGVAAAVENAGAMARAGDVQRAGSELSGVSARSPHILAMQAALARAAGDAAAAKSAVTLAASMDATDSVIRFEQVRQGASDPKLWEHLAADPERVLEIAALYMHWGRYKDALEALMYHYAPVPPTRREPGAVTPQDYPLPAYYRGYCRQKLNEASEDFRSACDAAGALCFSGRPAERRILQAALQANGGDESAHYLLGLWYLNAQQVAEGTRELQAAETQAELAEARRCWRR